jgi:hypothetical protein
MPSNAPGCRVRRGLLLVLAALGPTLVATGSAHADDTSRVVLITTPQTAPDGEAVRAILAAHLSRVEVDVDVAVRESMPSSEREWTLAAKDEAADRPGTLAVFGWRCEADACDLFAAETRSGGVARIPVRPIEHDDGEDTDLAFAIAATVREAVWGGLLLEMNRLAEEGARPDSPPPSGERMPEPYKGSFEAGGLARAHRPWFWLEGSYHGECPYPRGDILHGPAIGFALSPGKNVVPVLRVGWLGMEIADNERGAVSAYRFPFELELRVAFPVGPAMFSIAPIGRVDLVVATADPAGPRSESTTVDAALHVGGMTTWHMPLPGGKVEALVAVGVLATIIGQDLEIDGVGAVPSAKLRVVWSAGVSWSPL